ncbi:MAG: hypothetical protein WCF84_11840, partial [Anaerolineae bacterium]
MGQARAAKVLGRPSRRIRLSVCYSLTLGAIWFLVHSAFIIWDGLHDRLAPADLAVVLGNKVEQNGQPSWGLQTRLDKALQL